VPDKSTIEGSEANAAAIRSFTAAQGTASVMRQVSYLQNIVGQDHRGVKCIVRRMLGVKSCETAQRTLAGSELMYMLRKGQLQEGAERGLTPAEQFHSLAA
jgi:transposase-like protein